jgi:hypothetical protein
MLDEPILGGKAVTASTDDLTPGRAKTGRPYPQALRSGVVAGANPDFTLDQLQEELRVRGIRSTARRCGDFSRSRIETGNERGRRRRYAMQMVCAIVAVMAVVASPSFAQSASKAQKQHSLQPSSYGAYGGHKRYTDPDPNIQFEMMRQRNWSKGG